MRGNNVARYLLIVALYRPWLGCSFPLYTSSNILTFCVKEIPMVRRSATGDRRNIIDRSYEFNSQSLGPLPFTIDQAKMPENDKEAQEISQLVISVFFEEETEKNKQRGAFNLLNFGEITMPWTLIQLQYLRHLYNSDLRLKRIARRSDCYDMFIARELLVVDDKDTSSEIFHGPVYNVDNNFDSAAIKLKKGQIIGFVDITERPFGLIPELDKTSMTDPGDAMMIGKKSETSRPLRPILTNLSVKKEYRQSGVGSKLIECCEKAVAHTWSTKYDEILLEVEKDNLPAQKFYEKRGYKALFVDPACRRLDTSGFFLRQVRTAKVCYRKSLDSLNMKEKGDAKAVYVLNPALPSMEKVFRSIRSLIESVQSSMPTIQYTSNKL